MVVVDSKTKKLKRLEAQLQGEGFFSDMAAKVRQYINPKLTSSGIYSTNVGIKKSSIRQPVQPQQTPEQPAEKQGYFNSLMYGRNDFPPAARAILKLHGEKRITKAIVIRQPVMSFNTKLLNFVSFGAFQESLDKQPYDTLFHLRSVFTLEDGTRVQVEKSEVIHIDTKITVVKGQQEQEVDLPQEPMTINKFLEGAKKILKGNMYSYDGFKNNCQDFQIAMYRGADLLTPELETFIKQDVSEIAESSPIISKAANLVTGLGGKFNELIHGAGIHKKFNKTHLVQSVVFDKKKWKLNDAIKWLDENNYHSPKVDSTTKTMRFRQIDPIPYKSPDWKYTTHRLGNGIDLIILYRMTGTEHPIETPKGLSKGRKQHLISGNGLHKLNSFTNVVPNQKHMDIKQEAGATHLMEGEGIIDTIIEFVKSLSKRNQSGMMQEVQTRQTIKDKKDADRFKLFRQLQGEAMKDRTSKDDLERRYRGYGISGGTLSHSPQTQWEMKHDIPDQYANIRDTTKPMDRFSPLDMKLSTQNLMLNNLKKSDLQDLALMKNQSKSSTYDREAIIQKIKGLTKSRVKKEVKAVKTSKPRNIKTRGSLESKKALLEQKPKRKYVKKIKQEL